MAPAGKDEPGPSGVITGLTRASDFPGGVPPWADVVTLADERTASIQRADLRRASLALWRLAAWGTLLGLAGVPSALLGAAIAMTTPVFGLDRLGLLVSNLAVLGGSVALVVSGFRVSRMTNIEQNGDTRTIVLAIAGASLAAAGILAFGTIGNGVRWSIPREIEFVGWPAIRSWALHGPTWFLGCGFASTPYVALGAYAARVLWLHGHTLRAPEAPLLTGNPA